MTLLLRLRTGSHLYGTAHAASDEDWYEVHDRLPGHRQARQSITGDQDVTQLGLSEFMRQADAGVPQALEVMFAPLGWPEVDTIAALRCGFYAGTQALSTYARTITNFDKAKPTVKRSRHAVRLAYCREQLVMYGRFDPTDRRWVALLPGELAFARW